MFQAKVIAEKVSSKEKQIVRGKKSRFTSKKGKNVTVAARGGRRVWLSTDESEEETLAQKGRKAKNPGKSSASKTGTTPPKGSPVIETAGNTVVTASNIVAQNQSPPSPKQTSPPETPPQPSSQNLGRTIPETVASSPLKPTARPSPSKVDELQKKLRNEPVVASNYGNLSNLTEDPPDQTRPERQNFDKRPKRTAKAADWYVCVIKNKNPSYLFS